MISPHVALCGENPNRDFQEEIRKPMLQDPIARDNLASMISCMKLSVFYQDPIVPMAVRDSASAFAYVTPNLWFLNTYLLVGCCNDEVSHMYKGKTVLTEAECYGSLRHCRSNRRKVAPSGENLEAIATG